MPDHIKTITQIGGKRFIRSVAVLLCYEGERELRRERGPPDSLLFCQGSRVPSWIG
jgi:hypothetical protein